MDHIVIIKWLHIVSSTILFGTGIGTAFFMWSAHLTKNPATISSVAGMVVRADWLFTVTSGVVQPTTGFMLVHAYGYDPVSAWLIWTYALYAVALVCWLPVVRLQIQMRDLATESARLGAPLTDAYHRAAYRWFALGWPAFLALLLIFYLMLAKP